MNSKQTDPKAITCALRSASRSLLRRLAGYPGRACQLRISQLRVSSAKPISERAVCANAPPRISSTTRYRMLRPRTANWGGPSQISHSLGEIPAQICTTQDPLSLGFEP